ncbi:hypothetical protein [Aliivibrio fischeri]|uniref:Phage tail tape measure protein n=1 Tax=Aliivibrio fischeri SR5 TaxID=1088719 RepID=A0AAV3EVX0_ALIFS|nr:hypothetical protein [Aliivibrio fischeri]EHN70921.1 hypothetical protein VFSR5_0701 [Aliivibrio fischeri SR5]
MANYELILAPEINRDQLRKAEKETKEAFERFTERVAIKAKKEFVNGLVNYTDISAAKELKKSSSKLKLASATIIAAADGTANASVGPGSAGKIAEVITDLIAKNLGGADDVASRFKERLNNISDTITTGEVFDIKSGAMAALTASFMAKGINPNDLHGMLAGFSASLEAEGTERYKQISKNKGFDTSFLAFLKSTSQLAPPQQMKTLIPVLGKKGAILASRMIKVIEGMDDNNQDVTTASLAQEVVGKRINIPALTTQANKAQAQFNELSQTRAQAFLDEFKPINDEYVQALKDLTKSNHALEKAHEEAFGLKVGTSIVINKLEIAQIDTISTITDEATNYFSELQKRYEAVKNTNGKDFSAKTFELLTYSPFEAMTGKNIFKYIYDETITSNKDEISHLSESRKNSDTQNSEFLTGPKK